METSHGWLRASLRLRGNNPKYNSLKEAYYMTALVKEQNIEAKKSILLAMAATGAKSSSVQNALSAYLEEVFPALAESREAFIEMGREILETEAGRVVDLSQYYRLD